ncbi:MAG: hypothetical protein HQK55_03175 [Deltaproteobacteria bacterium]|nr:hypothetical protein [Deltaproteobacteria bacterium]
MPVPIYLLIASWGALALVGQVVLTRQLLVAFYGHETIIAVVMAGWLSGVFLGAATAGRFDLGRRLNFWLWFGSTAWMIVLAVLLILSYNLPILMGVAPGEIPPFERLALWSILLTVPASFFVGALFVLAGWALSGSTLIGEPELGSSPPGDGIPETIISPDKKHGTNPSLLGGTIFWVEAAGSCLGLLIYTFVLLGRISPVQVLTLFGGLVLVIQTTTMSKRRAAFKRLIKIFSVLILTVLLFLFGGHVDNLLEARRFHLAFPNYRLIETRETPYQHLALARRSGETALFGNLVYFSSWPNPAIYQPLSLFFLTETHSFRRVLLIGQGPGGYIHELLRQKVEQLVYVVLDPFETDLVYKYLPPEMARDLSDPRLTIIHSDPRRYLAKPMEPTFDLIVINAPDPDNAQINRLYTLEFFQDVRRGLTPDGVMVTSINGADNYWGREMVSYGLSLYRTLTAVFPQVMVTPGDRHYFLAGNRPGLISDDPAVLAQRYQARGFQSEYLTPRALTQFFPPTGKNYLKNRLTANDPAGAVRQNTDAAPLSYLLRLTWWEQMTGSPWSRAILGWAVQVKSWGPWAIGLLAIPWLWLCLWPRPAAVAAWTLASSGGVTMALNILLMFMYQNRYGVLYQQLGLFSAVFMAGLAMGGLTGPWLAKHGLTDYPANQSRQAAGAEGLLALLAGATGLAAGGHWPLGLLSLLLLIGLVGGLEFSLLFSLSLSDPGRPEQTKVLAELEAADHGGAIFGALLTGLIMAPVLGLEMTAFILAGVKIAGGLLMLRVRLGCV